MHMSMLGLKHLEQKWDEQQRSTYSTRYERHEELQGTRYEAREA